jgi:2-C-methyl-D-erythritol 2,4-cyclodiphosphate synthase
LRIGSGFDVHPFRDEGPLLLGGLAIPYHRGLAGHSDADVLLHAISDALLGAAALGDIGQHFPDNDPSNRGRSSLEMLARISDLVTEAGFSVTHVDSCIMAEAPKLSPHYPEMRANIARCLGLDPRRVGVKATTTEGLGFTGREEGIAAHAVCLLIPTARGRQS